MTITYKCDTGTLLSNSTTGLQSISFVSTQPVTGDFIVAGGAFAIPGTCTPTVSDNQGNTYALDEVISSGGTAASSFSADGCAIFSKSKVTASGTVTMSFSCGGGGGQYLGVGAVAFTGVKNPGALDVKAHSYETLVNKTSQNAGTPSASLYKGSLVVTVLDISNSNNLSSLTVSGYTVPVSSPNGTVNAVGGLAYKIMGPTAIESPTWNYGATSGASSNNHAAAVAIYSPASFNGEKRESYTDDFNRADETPIATPWTATTLTKHRISSNVILAGTSNQDNLTFYNKPFTPNQFSRLRVVGNVTNPDGGPAVRIDKYGNGFALSNYTGQIVVGCFLSGSWNEIGSYYSYSWVANDIIELRAAGDWLEVYINSIRRVLVNDTRITSGSPGVFSYDGSQWDDWSGGDVAINYANGNILNGGGASSFNSAAFNTELGDLIVIGVLIDRSVTNNPPIVTDTAGNVYLKSNSLAINSDANAKHEIFYCLNSKAQTSNTITINFGSFCTPAMQWSCYRSYVGRWAVDFSSEGTASAYAIYSATTPAHSSAYSDLVICFGIAPYEDATVWTWDSKHNKILDLSGYASMADRISMGAITSESATVSFTSATGKATAHNMGFKIEFGTFITRLYGPDANGMNSNLRR